MGWNDSIGISEQKKEKSITATKRAFKASEDCPWFVFSAQVSRLFTFSIV